MGILDRLIGAPSRDKFARKVMYRLDLSHPRLGLNESGREP
jgi:hypothetical protein